MCSLRRYTLVDDIYIVYYWGHPSERASERETHAHDAYLDNWMYAKAACRCDRSAKASYNPKTPERDLLCGLHHTHIVREREFLPETFNVWFALWSRNLKTSTNQRIFLSSA